jgi:hypothetical protein
MSALQLEKCDSGLKRESMELRKSQAVRVRCYWLRIRLRWIIYGETRVNS